MAGRRRVEGVLLAPGAGGDSSHHTLRSLVDALHPLPVHVMDFPYRLAGRRAPDRAPVLIEAMRAELELFRDRLGARDTSRIVLGGRSMGGRISSILAAGGQRCRGLALLSYPLHPVGRPEKLRVDHFAEIVVPVLFLSGDRDNFGTPEEFGRHIGAIPGPVTQQWLAGRRHDPVDADDEIGHLVGEWVRSLR
jgi:predicted alpha/beta-hydrolase family hydrolase